MIARILRNTLLTLFVVTLLAFAVDSLLWQQRLLKGKGFGTVEVSRMSVATLKSHKAEYYFEGKDMVQCSHSTLPMPTSQGFFKPCWWMERHHDAVTTY